MSPSSRTGRNQHLLGDLILCWSCGRAMDVEDRAHPQIPVYACRLPRSNPSPPCQTLTLITADVDCLVLGEVMKAVMTPGNMSRLSASIDQLTAEALDARTVEWDNTAPISLEELWSEVTDPETFLQLMVSYIDHRITGCFRSPLVNWSDMLPLTCAFD